MNEQKKNICSKKKSIRKILCAENVQVHQALSTTFNVLHNFFSEKINVLHIELRYFFSKIKKIAIFNRSWRLLLIVSPSSLSLSHSDIYYLHNPAIAIIIIFQSIAHDHKTRTATQYTFFFSLFCHFLSLNISLVYSFIPLFIYLDSVSFSYSISCTASAVSCLFQIWSKHLVMCLILFYL